MSPFSSLKLGSYSHGLFFVPRLKGRPPPRINSAPCDDRIVKAQGYRWDFSSFILTPLLLHEHGLLRPNHLGNIIVKRQEIYTAGDEIITNLWMKRAIKMGSTQSATTQGVQERHRQKSRQKVACPRDSAIRKAGWLTDEATEEQIKLETGELLESELQISRDNTEKKNKSK